MAINTLYIPLFTLEEVMLDKDTGLPLAGGLVKFFIDAQRVTPKVVFQISGTSPNYTFTAVGSEFTLGLNGTFIDGSGNPFVPYAYPYDTVGKEQLYYVTVESSGSVSQFTRDAVPYLSGATSPSERSNTENELTNPQFVEVFFPSSGTHTFSVTGSNTVTQIAPGWDLITTGTGNVDIERIQPTAANVPTNPPYTLRISAAAALGATVTLRQRLNNSPSLLRGGYASVSISAAVISGGASSISISYAPSTGTATTVLANTAVVTDGAYHILAGNKAIPDQANDAAVTGYVDLNILIPTSRSIAVTSIQLVGASYSIDIPFDEQSSDRQKDHLFHYYQNALVRQPKASILAGWDFALNPWQYRAVASANVAANQYTADQTIVIQQAFVTSATADNVAVGRASHTANFAYQVTAVTAANKIALLNYVDPETARPYWGEKLSVRLRASITLVAPNVTTPTFKVRLIHKSGLPTVPMSQTVPVSVWANTDDSIPTISSSGWTYLKSTNDPTYTLTGTMTDFDFDGFELPVSDSADMTLGVMFIMMDNLDETGTADVLNFEEISLVHNDFALSPNPLTLQEAKSRCEYFYENSYQVPQPAPGTGVVTAVGELMKVATINVVGTAGSLGRREFDVRYRTTKRVTPATKFYNPTLTTVDTVRVEYLRIGAASLSSDLPTSQYTAEGASIYGVIMVPNTTGEILSRDPRGSGDDARSIYHYEADARLGIV